MDLLVRFVLIAALLGVTLLAWWLTERGRGRLRAPADAGAAAPSPLHAAVLAGKVQVAGGPVVVQLSNEVCAPCRTSARRWREATGGAVPFVELDAADHLGLVRSLGVLRTPTTVVLGADGTELGRVSGVPDPDEARRVVREVAPAAVPVGAPAGASR